MNVKRGHRVPPKLMGPVSLPEEEQPPETSSAPSHSEKAE